MDFSNGIAAPANWRNNSIGEVCTIFTSGGTPSRKRADFYSDGDIPWVKTQELQDRVIISSDEHITKDGLANSSAKLLPQETVLMAMYGATVGRLGILGIEATCNQASAAMCVGQELAEYRFLFYLLKTHRERIIEQASGGAQQNLSGKQIKDFRFNFPPVSEQEAIAEILWSLDKSIWKNEETAATLESIAQTLFRSWFVDFDPVRAKMASEKLVGMDDATAALFPDSMEESELGDIPAGWSVSEMKDVCDRVANGSTPLRSNEIYWTAGDIPWFKTGELSDGFLMESTEKITAEAVEKTSVKFLPTGSVLVAIYASPTVGRLGILTRDSTFNQACTGLQPASTYGTGFLFLSLQAKREYFNALAIGAAQQNISKQVVEKAPVVVAPPDVHKRFQELVNPLFDQIESLAVQSVQLAQVRDTLLPRLISGQLQVPEDLVA